MNALRWHRFAPLLLVAAGTGLVFVACGPSDHGDRTGGDFNVNPNPTPGGPCTDGATRTCAIELGAHDGVIDCAAGTMTCVGGTWAGCVPVGSKSYSVAQPPPSTPTSAGAGTLGTKTVTFNADGGTSSNCVDDPCNPYCNGFKDTPPSDAGYTTEAGSLTTFVTGTFVLLSEIPTGSIPGGFLNAGNVPGDCASTDPLVRARACQYDQHCDTGATRCALPWSTSSTTIGGVTYCCRSWEAGEYGAPPGCTGVDVEVPPTCTPATPFGVRSVDICSRGTLPLTEDVKCYSWNSSIFPPSDTPDLSTATLVMDTAAATPASFSTGHAKGDPIGTKPIPVGECRQYLVPDGDFGGTGNRAVLCNRYTLAAATTTDFYPTTVTAASLGLGAFHGCVVLGNGGLKCWGYNWYGQVGDGSTTDRSTPVTVTIGSVAQVTGSWYGTCAAMTDGTAKCWGYNGYGQLGDGTTTSRSTPVTVTGLSGVTQVSANQYHACARLGTGAVQCWGENASGELGDGTNVNRSTPAAVTGLTNATSIATGYDHTCANLGDGTVRCWGDNTYGQLGNGTTTSSSTPVTVSGITNAVSVRASATATCARLSDGTVKCWGYNGDGELGDGTFTNRSTPVAVSGITTAVALGSAGYHHSCVRLADNTVKCWGWNANGQLGNGTTTTSPTPVTLLSAAATTQAGVATIAPGYNSSCALVSGTLKCWGDNFSGQLANGTTTASLYPTTSTLGSIDNWINPRNALLATDSGASATAMLSAVGANRITLGNFGVVVPPRIDANMLFSTSARWNVTSPATNSVFVLGTSFDAAVTFPHVTTVDPAPTALTTQSETPYAVTAAQLTDANLKVTVDAKLKGAGNITASLDWAKVSLTTQKITSLPECNISNNWTVTKGSPSIPCGGYPIKTTTYMAEPWTVTRQFNAVCPTGTAVAWRRFGYTSSTPTGTSIDFRFHAVAQVKNATTGVMECPAATPETTSTPFMTAVNAPTDKQNCSVSSVTSWGCPVDLNTNLGTNASKGCLEMDAYGNPLVTSTSASSPALYTWNVTYDCIPSE
jgi:alpha-tubulin suppressor-like RCC1 family protein